MVENFQHFYCDENLAGFAPDQNIVIICNQPHFCPFDVLSYFSSSLLRKEWILSNCVDIWADRGHRPSYIIVLFSTPQRCKVSIKPTQKIKTFKPNFANLPAPHIFSLSVFPFSNFFSSSFHMYFKNCCLF